MDLSVTLPCTFYDGLSTRGRPALLQLQSAQLVVLSAEAPYAPLTRAPSAKLDWPEQTRASNRMLSLPQGASVHSKDAAAWDAWVKATAAHHATPVQEMQRQWRWAAFAVLALLGFVVAVQLWGITAFARSVVAALPAGADQQLGDAVWPQIERTYLKPSALSADEQARWASLLGAVVKKAYPSGHAPDYELLVRGSKIGPNAFALPGGRVVLTDELVKLAAQEPALAEAMVLGVLAHELGHVQARHSMRHVVSALSLGVLSTWLLGDVSGALSSLHVAIGQASYSRDVEREADDTALHIMQRAGIDPRAMVRFFQLVRQAPLGKHIEQCQEEARKRLVEKRSLDADPTEITAQHIEAQASDCKARAEQASESASRSSGLGIAFSSHPADAERMRKFESARP